MTPPDEDDAALAGGETERQRTDDRPGWWRENERLRAEMDLPEYRPPRFSDGTYTHEVTAPLERAHGCVIRFVGVNTRYPEDWAVRVDGEPAFGIGRHRDERGNTVYELSTEAFREAVEEAIAVRRG